MPAGVISPISSMKGQGLSDNRANTPKPVSEFLNPKPLKDPAGALAKAKCHTCSQKRLCEMAAPQTVHAVVNDAGISGIANDHPVDMVLLKNAEDNYTCSIKTA